jgi:aspartate/methionine/tyrosine aminotransferase
MTVPSSDLRPFLLERWFAQHEFAVPHMLSASDCQPLTAKEALRLAGTDPTELLDLPLGYTQSRGDPELRAAIAAWYPGCAPDDVLVCNAPQEAILLAMQALLRPGDRVVVQTPCYQSLAELPRSLGCEVVPWPVRLGDDGPALELDHLARLLATKTALLVTNAPHNPTGVHPDQDQWREIAAMAEESGARWFSDEMYRGLCPDPAQELAPAAAMVGSAVSLWGASKSFGLPGIRIGWLCSRDRALLARIEERKDYTTICSSGPGEVLARAVLRAADAILLHNRERIATNAAAMTAFAARHPDLLRWQPPQAGPVALAEILGEPATELAERVRRHGALLVPSALFDLEDRCVRIGLGRDHFANALAAWEQALRAR